jgi:hypothetical protein
MIATAAGVIVGSAAVVVATAGLDGAARARVSAAAAAAADDAFAVATAAGVAGGDLWFSRFAGFESCRAVAITCVIATAGVVVAIAIAVTVATVGIVFALVVSVACYDTTNAASEQTLLFFGTSWTYGTAHHTPVALVLILVLVLVEGPFLAAARMRDHLQ